MCETLKCENCGFETFATRDGKKDMKIHSSECDWEGLAKDRFDPGDPIEYSKLGIRRLGKEQRKGEIEWFSTQDDTLVRVRWDGRESHDPPIYHHYLKKREENNDE